MRRTVAIAAFVLASLGLFAYSVQPDAVIAWSEALGFITGALCVWMTVYENVWNFPVGIANCVFFIILFFEKRLYADFGLQFLYIALGLQGWYLWLYGGGRPYEIPDSRGLLPEAPVDYPRPERRVTVLEVSRATRRDWVQAVLILALGLPLLTVYLTKLNGAAPFMDSLLTSMSVVAQLLLNRKRIENWLVWIAADVMYVGLFAYKALYLTALLYAVFCVLAIAGYREWQRALDRSADASSAHDARNRGPQGI